MVSFQIIVWLSGALALASLIYFFVRSDETPLLMTMLYGVAGLYRYYVVALNPNNRKVGWVVVAYSRNIFSLNNELALQALNYFFLGTLIWVLSYMAWKTFLGRHTEHLDVKPMLTQFLQKKRSIIIGLFAAINISIFFAKVFLISRAMEMGSFDTSTSVSYLLLLPFAIGGIIILMYMVYESVSYQTDPTSKLVFLGLVLVASWLSWNPGARFNFLSWVIVLAIIIVRDRPIWFKTRLYVVGLLGLMIVYSMAGLTRTPGAYLLKFEDQVDLALERLETAEDENLLDGFMMALQVYPANLNYQYGFQHLEILLRPIPRAIWPGKPLGGYANKLGLNDFGENSGLTIGISESIYGTFYGEGGVAGIVIFSIIHGCFFAWLMYRSERYTSNVRFLIKGLILASLVALIRGGDLAGIVAFIGMSFWPVLLFMIQYGNFVTRFNAWFLTMQRARQLRVFSQPEKPIARPEHRS